MPNGIQRLTYWFCARYAPTPDVAPQGTHDRNTNTLGHKSMAIDEGTSSSRDMVSPGADANNFVPHQVCPKSNSSKKNKGRRRKNKEPGSKNEGPSRKVYSIPEVANLVEAVKKYGIGRYVSKTSSDHMLSYVVSYELNLHTINIIIYLRLHMEPRMF